MAIFDAGSVVRVPFPYTDRDTRQHRPALVISNGGVGPDRALLWVVMITSAENRHWSDDVAIEDDHAAAGLPVPSLIRTAKIATIDAAAAHRIGSVEPACLARVRERVAHHLGLSLA